MDREEGAPEQRVEASGLSEPKPFPRSLSLQSDKSLYRYIDFKRDATDEASGLSGPKPSPRSLSLKSDGSLFRNIDFKRDAASDCDSAYASVSCDRSLLRNWDFPSSSKPKTETAQWISEETLNSIFTRLEHSLISFVKEELKRYHRVLASDYPQCLENEEDEEQRNRESFLNITMDVLRRMQHQELAEKLHCSSLTGVYQRELKSSLQQRFSHVFEGVAKAGDSAPLNQIFTELYITEGGASEVNQEHEVRHMEMASRRPVTPEMTITCEDIFKDHAHRQGPIRAGVTETQGPIRAVLTKGVAGVGKTVLTQKFSLDWAEGRAHQDLQLLFPFTFRELNVFRDTQFSLVELLHHFFSPSKRLCNFEDLQVLFIFDGLDECRLPLDFRQTKALSDPTESASVHVLLVNLIRGSLLPSARLWITTRPAAANQIPAECVSMVTEVRGFTDPQKEQYFRKRFIDQATAVISHIKSVRSLHIMCHIPIFCWILSVVIQKLLEQTEPELPRTLTQMYVHLLVVQLKQKNVKYDGKLEADSAWSPENREMVKCLGKLAFEQLQKGNLIFYESDLSECGLDTEAVSVYSGVFTQVFREEPGLYQDKVYCFIHLSVQEFLAALHVHQTFYETGVNLLFPEQTHNASRQLFYQKAVDQALQSSNGHWDLFLRFLLGLSLPTNQSLLQGLIPQTGGAAEETAVYIKLKMNECDSTERALNLLHGLGELNDRSLLDLVQSYLRAGQFSRHMPPAQWSALAFILLSSDTELDLFDLRRFRASQDVLLRLLPVIKASSRAILSACGLGEEACAALSKVVFAQSSCLKELDLSQNNLGDSGLQLLTEGLQSPHCTLESLRLQCCSLSEQSCGLLSSVLSCSSGLKHLDLSNNDLKDSGVVHLSEGLRSPNCKLQSLSLSGCLISGRGASVLCDALNLNSRLMELDLSYNHTGLPGVTLLSSVEKSLKGSLSSLRLTPSGEQFLKPGLKKYFTDLSLDLNTAYRKLDLSSDLRTVIFVEEEQPYPDLQTRFDWYPQVLCSTALTARHYWEVEWSGVVSIAVSYKDTPRKGRDTGIVFGQNSGSWRIWCSNGRISVCGNNQEQYLDVPPWGAVGRVAVFLDREEGFLSFYRVLENRLVHLHTFSAAFSQPLYAGFGFGSCFSSANLICRPEVIWS
ncbi:NLR family CARD domain-containing protein 3-like isoform X2 [Boleophthalmus pectinirostris]|uniref:NLR family CARD domain-containing protein 3-like isoform X2 n=1 Tax=Boleophthalmus pectinirostris TaxID=150288 RepID=UPI0024325F53|nr:NLR family CARD domain-containing protein 3-like isoform X2 [Boleophthalmus pectinirostris]